MIQRISKLKKNAHAVIILFFINGCVNPPSYDIVPEIKFLSLSRYYIEQQPFDLDSVRAEFSFTDGDGDIGFETIDTAACKLCDSSCYHHGTFNLFLTDNRTGCLTPFKGIPYIPPKGSSDAISGKVEVVISTLCCISPEGFACNPSTEHPYDTVVYSIQMKDVAGNLSNKIDLPPIVIRCN